jgi:EAL domain-containing protein (putative c-di-GMP-specific phosphodiesterase class I)
MRKGQHVQTGRPYRDSDQCIRPILERSADAGWARGYWCGLDPTRPIPVSYDLHLTTPTPEMPQQPADCVPPRRADNNERFVAFAFAAADLVVEVEPGGRITCAAGAFQTRLGQAPEAFIGRPIRDVVDPMDHATLDAALMLLSEKGRLLPLMIRLADRGRTRLALAGLRYAVTGCPVRLYLTFAVPPAPLAVPPAATPHAFARASEARLRAGPPSDISLLEIRSGKSGLLTGGACSSVLQRVAPDVLASEIAPGRFGLLDAGGRAGLIAIATSLEAELRAQDVEVAIASHNLPLAAGSLTAMQAARALRLALATFARDGVAGVNAAGFTGGLAGYLSKAAVHTDALRRAIRMRCFDLLFQPIVSLADRSLHHYEALLRPRPVPGCAFATPQDFVVLVEALGLAGELDLTVADLVSDAAAASAVPVAFNLSAQSLQSGVFRDRLLALLSTSHACRAGRLIAEMTETAEVEDIAEATRTAEALRTIGVPFCLDDFGAGAADMRLLRALPADMVKLDGSYVPGVARDARDRSFVSGMIDIARAVKAAVVAEQIEADLEADTLLAMGVTYGQGWLFGRPAPLPVSNPRRTIAGQLPNARRRGKSKETWE